MSGYDTAITVFSPNGHLFQVEYALEAVKKGLCSVAIKAKDCLIIGVEKKTVQKLQDGRTLRKILNLDQNISMAFSGLNADSRILANMIRVHIQSYKLSYDEQPPVDYVAKYVAQTQQRFTQKGGARPFGISTLICGFDSDRMPRLFETDPSGACVEWKAHALGRSQEQCQKFIQKHWKDGMDREVATRLVIQTLLDVVESGQQNIEIQVVTYQGLVNLNQQEIQLHTQAIQAQNL